MKYNISKELFEAVMETSVYRVYIKKNIIENTDWDYENGTEWHNDNISINDFFFKCKEWALKQGYFIESSTNFYGGEATLYNVDDPVNVVKYIGNEIDSEQQAVFDACMWILETISIKEQ